MSVLLDDLLDYATADNRPLADLSVDLQPMVEAVAADRVGDGPADVVVDALPAVRGDPTLLRQVFDNLIGNAVKYTPVSRTPQVRVSCQATADEQWRFEVADNGIGIPAEERGAVFDAFTRAGGSEGFPGTGLGLAIVHRIVERHHGCVGADTNPDGGSIFWFTLPVDVPMAEDSVSGDESGCPVHAHQVG